LDLIGHQSGVGGVWWGCWTTTPWFEVLEIKISIKKKTLNCLFAKNNNDCTCYAYYRDEGLHCKMHELKKNTTIKLCSADFNR